MMISSSDKRLILAAIKYGEPSKLLNLAVDLSPYTKSKLVSELRDTDEKRYNYKLSEKISNILIPSEGSNKLKRSISDLISVELIYSNENRDKIYRQINTLATNLVSFPVQKRIHKFISRFVMSSKSLRETLNGTCDLKILKIIQNVCLESRKHANI